MTNRPGFALLVSLLLTLALAVLGAAMLVLAERENELATAWTIRTRARAAAETGARAALAAWSTRRYSHLAPGETLRLEGYPDDRVSVAIRRLDSSMFLLAVTASQPLGTRTAAARAAVVVATLDASRHVDAFPAAAMAGSEAVVLRGEVVAAAGSGDAAALMSPSVSIAPDATVVGSPAVISAEPPALSTVPFLTPAVLDSLATTTVADDLVSPRPVSGGGGCVPDPVNWGAVSPSDPCYDLTPLVRSESHLVVRGGEGRGLLVVEGDLEVEDFLFQGIILVRGSLTIGPGAAVQGAVRAETLEIDGGSVRFDSHAIAHALNAGPLDAPFRPGRRSWIPAF